MKCPHCHTGIKLDIKKQVAFSDNDYSKTGLGKEFIHGICPECDNLVVSLKVGKYRWVDDMGEVYEAQQEIIIYPQNTLRVTEALIPEEYRNAFNEANSVLPYSPKASAALGRRLLQQILRDKYEIERHDLSKQIDDFLTLPNLPFEISGAVDAIRQVGNFAAHPLKYTNTGEIVEVENGEAEWTLDVLEQLLDFAFVQPVKAQSKRDELNKKLTALGKGQLKG
jgi:hypothetical protein